VPPNSSACHWSWGANAGELGLRVVIGGARVTGLEVVAAPVANAVEMLDEEAHTQHQRLSAARGDTVVLLLAGGDAGRSDRSTTAGVDAGRNIAGQGRAEEVCTDNQRAHVYRTPAIQATVFEPPSVRAPGCRRRRGCRSRNRSCRRR
jgi:hypothetical protein